MTPPTNNNQVARAAERPAGGAKRGGPVLGGSLTRPEGERRQTLQTHGIHPSPALVQQVWSHVRRRRYPQSWEGSALEDFGYIITWAEPRALLCGNNNCGRTLGRYVAYQARDEYGIVEDTARTYDAVARPMPGQRRPRAQPRFSLDGEAHGHAANTRAVFWCKTCKKSRTRNLAKLGQELFRDETTRPYLV